MSAVEEYREHMNAVFDTERNLPQFLRAPKAYADAAIAEMEARIAELEAENATVIKRAADAIIQQEKRAEQAEAALAERDGMLDCIQRTLREIRDASTVLGVRVGVQGALDNLADIRARAERANA